MNIFVLHENPRIAAEMHCDKHVPKMIVEHAQMLTAAYYSTVGISRKKEIPDKQNLVNELFQGWPRKNKDGSEWHYAITHVNHPCTVWTRASLENFNWLLECTEALCQEFKRRWKHEPSILKIVNWMKANPPRLKSSERTPFAQALPECYKNANAVAAYRKYYAFKTTYMKLNWKFFAPPHWWNNVFVEDSLSEYRAPVQG
jgi:hypothetical protein